MNIDDFLDEWEWFRSDNRERVRAAAMTLLDAGAPFDVVCASLEEIILAMRDEYEG